MSAFVVTKADEAFGRAILALDRSDDWKGFAVAGRTMAVFAGDFGLEREGRRYPVGLSVNPVEDRRAWLWGYHWQEGGPLPPERPAGACPECWRLGDACREHYRGLSRGEVMNLALQKLDGIVVDGELQVRPEVDKGSWVPADSISFERLQALVMDERTLGVVP